MDSGFVRYDLGSDLGAKTWGFVFFASFLGLIWACQRLIACCIFSQRARLRDEYEYELRRGGKLTNRLLLPVAPRVAWNPYSGQEGGDPSQHHHPFTGR